MAKRETFHLHYSKDRAWGEGLGERIPDAPRARSLRLACRLAADLAYGATEPLGYVKIVRFSDGKSWDSESLEKAAWGVFRHRWDGSRSEPSASEYSEAGELRNPQNYDPIPSRAWVACQGVAGKKLSKKRGLGVGARPLPVNDMTPPGPLPTAWVAIPGCEVEK